MYYSCLRRGDSTYVGVFDIRTKHAPYIYLSSSPTPYYTMFLLYYSIIYLRTYVRSVLYHYKI